jgi:hypothetical protein
MAQQHEEAGKVLCLDKSHANDAYAMGRLHPKHRTPFMQFRKLRCNNRFLEKFYDAKYTDARDGKKKKGSELSCGRTNRSESRHSKKNLRIYREKVSKGRRVIRRRHYAIRPGDIVVVSKKHRAKGVRHNGMYVALDTGKSVSVRKVEKVIHAGGYMPVK